jgi:hypothetical protein
VSDSDSFIDEVSDEVRRDRLFALLRRYGWIVIAAVLLIVGAAAFVEWQRARARSAAEGFGDAVIAAVGLADGAARLGALDAVAEAAAEAGADGGSKRAVAGFLGAGEALAAGDRDGARARLEAVAADAAVEPAYRDLAALKALILAGAAMPAAERDALLERLAAPGRPLRALAMEQQALVLVAAGDEAGALAQARAILTEPDLTQGLRQRVSQLIILLGGDPAAA